MKRPLEGRSAVTSKRRARAQLILCQGCCCGRTDRGFPAVPVDRIKGAWKAGALNKVVQLTISGCVGPCDVANVVLVLYPTGPTWLGELQEDAHYDALLDWAQRCRDAGRTLALPDALLAHRFEWFVAEPDATGAPAAAGQSS